MVMMVSAIVREVLRRRKEREGVGDVCCYSFGLGQCSNAKYTKSLYNFLSDILFILNQSNVFCVLYSGCQGNSLLTTSVICAPTFLLNVTMTSIKRVLAIEQEKRLLKRSADKLFVGVKIYPCSQDNFLL